MANGQGFDGPKERRRKRGPLIRVYETTVVEPEGELGAEISVLPLSAMEPGFARRLRKKTFVEEYEWGLIWEHLGFEPIDRVHPKRVVADIKRVFRYGPHIDEDQRLFLREHGWQLPGVPAPERGYLETPHPEAHHPKSRSRELDPETAAYETALQSFAYRLAHKEIIPVEQSPLHPESLAALIAKTTSESTGAATAWIGLWTDRPILIVGGLFGIVIVKVVEHYAEGAARAAEVAGERHFLNLLRVPQDKKPELQAPPRSLPPDS